MKYYRLHFARGQTVASYPQLPLCAFAASQSGIVDSLATESLSKELFRYSIVLDLSTPAESFVESSPPRTSSGLGVAASCPGTCAAFVG